MKTIRITQSLFAAMLICSQSFAQIPILNGYDSPLPTVVTPGAFSSDGGVAAPSDAISLFNGKDLSEWSSKKGSPDWTVQNGVFTVKEGAEDIFTKKEFSDFQLHIEWMHPSDITGEGQGRGNSGVYMQGLYEIQVLETYNNNNRTYVNGQAGAIYKQHSPLVNPLRKPGEWNSYDVIFTSPTFNSNGTYRTNPRLTVMVNGILVQNNAIIYGGTNDDKIIEKLTGPILLQNHGCIVNYRNAWIREL